MILLKLIYSILISGHLSWPVFFFSICDVCVGV